MYEKCESCRIPETWSTFLRGYGVRRRRMAPRAGGRKQVRGGQCSQHPFNPILQSSLLQDTRLRVDGSSLTGDLSCITHEILCKIGRDTFFQPGVNPSLRVHLARYLGYLSTPIACKLRAQAALHYVLQKDTPQDPVGLCTLYLQLNDQHFSRAESTAVIRPFSFGLWRNSRAR